MKTTSWCGAGTALVAWAFSCWASLARWMRREAGVDAAAVPPMVAAASPVAARPQVEDFPPVAGSAVAALPRRAVALSTVARLPRRAVADSNRLQRADGKARPALRSLLLSRARPARIRPSARMRPARTRLPGSPRERRCNPAPSQLRPPGNPRFRRPSATHRPTTTAVAAAVATTARTGTTATRLLASWLRQSSAVRWSLRASQPRRQSSPRRPRPRRCPHP